MPAKQRSDDGFSLIQMLTAIALLAVFMGNVLPALPQPVDPPSVSGPENLVCVRLTWEGTRGRKEMEQAIRSALEGMGGPTQLADFQQRARMPHSAFIGVWYAEDWDVGDLVERLQAVPGIVSAEHTEFELIGA